MYIVDTKISVKELQSISEKMFARLVKVVVDIEKKDLLLADGFNYHLLSNEQILEVML